MLEGNDTCLANPANRTVIFTPVYQGIPETLVLNLIGWLCLLLLFAVLRNYAWNYGRLALVQNQKWTRLFYANADADEEEDVADLSLSEDQGCCRWVPAVFTITREKFLRRCGPDALHYLSFQRHLMWFLTIVMFLAMTVILPINFQGTLQGDISDRYTFSHTTVSNLDPTSPWLWVHIMVSVLYVPLTVMVMRRCSGRLPARRSDSCTVMVTHISTNYRNADDIFNFFCYLYRSIEFKDVQLAYDISELSETEAQRECAHQARIYCERSQKEILVRPSGCLVCCPLASCGARDALEYYAAEEHRLSQLAESRRRDALARPLGIAFVTVAKPEDAKHIVRTFQGSSLRDWAVEPAPAPSDLFWENLHVSGHFWYGRAICVNVVLFVALFFLTTPAIVVNLLNVYYARFSRLSPTVSEFLPTLFLWTVTALMPALVAYSDRWLPHWTKSRQNVAVMQKTFIFLLFMVLILPSLGLTSAQALVEWSLAPGNRTYRWECVFLPDKGAFFVNYVITCAFLGTALELIRFPELIMYTWSLLVSRSPAERSTVQKAVLLEFPFGMHYAWTLLVYTVSVVYSIACPLVAPFGLLYLLMKHVVDRHNLYFAYRPTSMTGEGRQIHVWAVRWSRLAVVLLQVVMASFAVVRGGLGLMAMLTMAATVLTCGIFFFLGPFPTCKPSARRSDAVDQPTPPSQQRYVAPVLESSAVVAFSEPVRSATASSYGSSRPSDAPPFIDL